MAGRNLSGRGILNPMPANPKDESASERGRRLILAAVRAIPRGQVAGYGEVARRAGLPGRARLVARVLSAGDAPGLPWHRVLRSDGRVAFPEGSAGYDEQVQRLRAEGVRVEAGRVRGQRAAATLDEMLWAPPATVTPAKKKAVVKPKPKASTPIADEKRAVAKPKPKAAAAAAGTRRRR
jgi:methylated-DNA-protein-cysteine methyltransferase-like protein